MKSMPTRSVYAAGAVMALAAVIGVYLGVSRSLGAPSGLTDEGGAIVPSVTPVASAKPILAPVQVMDEAEVRKLAREEAQALLVTKPVVHKAPANDDDTDAAAPDQLTPVTSSAPPAKPAVSAPQG